MAVGSDVNLAGVAVGRVTRVRLDDALMSEVTFSVSRGLRLPADSKLSVGGTSFAGAAVLEIEPGHSPRSLPARSDITDTSPPGSIEGAIGNYVFGNGGLAGTD